MAFVTDFIWRSPLGLRINAQDTAGVAQTEDWVKIRGDQLAARDGVYDLRITAELWETHFFDHVSLLVVDHPADRGLRGRAVRQRRAGAAVRMVTGPYPSRPSACDDPAPDVTDIVAGERRPVPRHVRAGAPTRASRATTSSRSSCRRDVVDEHVARRVARGPRAGCIPDRQLHQRRDRAGRASQPQGLSLEARRRGGRWIRPVAPDLGFPAGQEQDDARRPDARSCAPASRRGAAAARDQPRDLLGLAGASR